jgi:hypothetical protein
MRARRTLGRIAVGVCFSAFVCSGATGQDYRLQFGAIDPALQDYGYVEWAARWFSNVIAVCWEDATSNQQERLWVEQAVESTWVAHSGVVLLGWDQCTSLSRGIRIAVEDTPTAPKTIVGRSIDGQPQGMRLNFTFIRWGTPCQKTRENCIISIAVHEFGHALGFAHENLRPDAPAVQKIAAMGGDGSQPAEGKILTLYDPHSVMNYCNVVYNNSGQLSPLDVEAIRILFPLVSVRGVCESCESVSRNIA